MHVCHFCTLGNIANPGDSQVPSHVQSKTGQRSFCLAEAFHPRTGENAQFKKQSRRVPDQSHKGGRQKEVRRSHRNGSRRVSDKRNGKGEFLILQLFCCTFWSVTNFFLWL